MMDTELERLQKEINGKVVVWVDSKEKPEIYIDAICIWPPNGEQISIKPYGLDVEEYYMLLHYNSDREYWSLEELSLTSDCLSAHKYPTIEEKLPMVRRIAEIEDGGVYDFNNVMGYSTGYGRPSCPYG
jgi:hypothetical protein